MATIKEIYDFLDRIAPFKTAFEFDNVGLLVGDRNSEVTKVLVALDITNEVCDEAKSLGAQLIISHHPVIFKALKSLELDSIVANLIQNKISAICAHTNLDVAPEGVNFHLAKKLGISEPCPLAYEENLPLGIVGNLSKVMLPNEFAKFVKEKLNCRGIRYTNLNKKIKTIAVCSGSGGNLVCKAHEKHVDAFVTGEIKHSDILKANHLGIMIVDVGHYKSENVIIEPLKNKLSKEFEKIKFFVSEKFTDKIEYLS